MRSRPGALHFLQAITLFWVISTPVALEAQDRNRSLVAWGEAVLGLNRAPELPPGVTASDVDAVVSGEPVLGVVLRPGILVGGTNYVGSRLVLRGPAMLTGSADGLVTYGTGGLEHTDQTSWNTALQDASGRLALNRVGFGRMFGALLRKPTNSPVPVPAGRFKDQYPGDLAFFGDRRSAGLPVTDADSRGGFVAVSVSATHLLALRPDGSVAAFGGDNLFGERLVPSGVVGAVEVAAGEFFSAALLSYGQVVVWGSDASGVVSVPAAATNVVSLKAGASHLVALRGDGTVVAWGSPADGRTAVPAGLSRVTRIAAGRAHSLALRDDGTVVAWGYNGGGQVSVPAGLVNVVDISAGGDHNLVLVSRERPVLDPLVVTETTESGARDFNPAVDYTDRGRTLVFRASLKTGAPPVQFRWRRNGALIPGATNAQLTLTVPLSEVGSFRVDAESVNAFGTDLRSTTVRIADTPSEISMEAASWRAVPGPTVATLGRNAAGTFLGVADAGLRLAFTVRAKGDPIPTVTVYDARTGEAVTPIDTPVTNATATAAGSSVVVSSRVLAVQHSGNYFAVLGNSLGKTVTNLVSVGVYPELVPPSVSSAVAPNSTVPTFLGPVAAGSTSVVFSVVSSHGPAVSHQWLKDGFEILRATNSVLALTNFSFAQIGTYSVRLSNPLLGSDRAADRARGTSISGGFIPVLPVTLALSRTNVTGLAGTAGGLEIQLAGALQGRVQLQRWEEISGWVDASASFPVVVPALPAAWAPDGTFELDLSGSGGRASFSVGTANLMPWMTGSYRVRAVQLASAGGVELAGTEQTVAFQVAVTSAAAISVPASAPPPVEGGGRWVQGASPGLDMTVAANAYSSVDLSAYLTPSGFPAPTYRWERQVDPASGSNPGRFVTVMAPTNSPRFVIPAVATNAGVYRIVSTNAVGGTNGVSRTLALRVDRMVRMPTETLASPGGTVEIPFSFVGFGDESAIAFTIVCRTPYLSAEESSVSITLDPALAATSTLSARRLGSVVAPPANGGVGDNQFRLQVLISQKDPTLGFAKGTNRIAKLSLQARTADSIAMIRNLGSSGVPVPPPLRVPVRILGDADLDPAFRDLAFRVAYTNATQAPAVVEGGGVAVLADSVEGDVNGTGSVDVLDITAIATALANKEFDADPVARRRADCAPRTDSGDWAINLADLVQVARYVARLDALQPAADPASGGPGYSLNASSRRSSPAKSAPRVTEAGPVRSLAFGWADLVAGEQAWVPILLEGVGDENAFSFNLEFDAQVLEFTGLRAPDETSFIDNRTGAVQGRVGAVLWKPSGRSAPAGVSTLVEAGFRVRATGGTTELRFGSVPLDSLIATVDAKPVQRVRFSANRLSIGQRRRVLGGRVVGQVLSGSEWRLELEPLDSAGKAVSAKDRRLRVRTIDQLGLPGVEWRDSGLQPEVTPSGNVRIPVPIEPGRASGFFGLVEE